MQCRYFLFIICLLLSQVLWAQTKIKVACVGNSITYGAGIKYRDSLSYPAQLQHMMGDKYIVCNFGVSGSTLLKKGNYPYWSTNAFQKVQRWDPDVVVIILGTNDTKARNWKYANEFGPNYRDFLEVFKKFPSHPQIWAALPVPVFKDKYGIRDSIVKVEIPIIRRVARKEKAHIMNLYKALKPYGKYFFDGVHPNKTGAYYLAKAVWRHIRHYNKK